MGRARKPRRARVGRGALMVIAGLLVGSAMLRMGSDAGQLLARATDAAEPMGEMLQEQATCTVPEDLHVMLRRFEERETRIEEHERAIAERRQALRLADEEIEAKLARLVAAEEQLRATIALADDAAEGDIARLVKVYENMKPKDAAALFEEMDPQFAAGFLGRMRAEAAAGIMAKLTPAAAHRFSIVLASRNAEVPTE